MITNLEQLFFTINKYKKYLYRIDAGRIYHCKLLGQFEFKSEFLLGLTKNWYIISHDLLRLNVTFSSFRLMLSHYKLCRKNYVQVADSDKRTDFFASVHVQYCGIRPPFIYYSTNPFLQIRLFQESSEIMSSFKLFYQSMDSAIISSGQDYSMDSFGYIIQSQKSIHKKVYRMLPDFILELNLLGYQCTTPYTNIYTVLVEMEKYKQLKLSMELLNISKLLIFDGPTVETETLFIYNSQEEMYFIDNIVSSSFQVFCVVFSALNALDSLFDIDPTICITYNTTDKPFSKEARSSFYVHFSEGCDENCQYSPPPIHKIYILKAEPFVNLTFWNYQYDGPNIGVCSFGGMGIYDGTKEVCQAIFS